MGRGGTLTLSPPDFSLFTAPASAGRCFVKDSAMKEAYTVNPDLTILPIQSAGSRVTGGFSISFVTPSFWLFFVGDSRPGKGSGY